MTAIDVWITDLRATKQSQFSQPLESPVDDAVAALQFIAAGLTPAGAEAANTFYAGPAAGVPALPTFRALVNADFGAGLSPSITGLTLSGNLTLSALTAGSVPFIGAAGLVTQDNANLSFDDVNHHIHIGSVITGDWNEVVTGDAFWQNAALGVAAGNYAVLQLADGSTDINAAATKVLSLRTGNTSCIDVDATAGTIRFNQATLFTKATLLSTTVALTNNAGASAGTLTNAPAAGNPTKWFPISDNGTVRNIPAW